MGKDPAVLLYTSDFLTGTIFMTDEQKGQYITLLCIQHQKGHIDESDILSIIKSYDSPVIKKFIKDKEGKYYNKRMEEVIVDRESYCNSRSHKGLSGRKKKNHTNTIRKSYGNHTEDENEDVIKGINNKYKPIDDCCFWEDKEFKESWNSWKSVRDKKGCAKTDRAIKSIVKKIMEYSEGNKNKAIILIDKAAENGWKSIYPDKPKQESKKWNLH